MTSFIVFGLFVMREPDVILWHSNPLLGIELMDLHTLNDYLQCSSFSSNLGPGIRWLQKEIQRGSQNSICNSAGLKLCELKGIRVILRHASICPPMSDVPWSNSIYLLVVNVTEKCHRIYIV